MSGTLYDVAGQKYNVDPLLLRAQAIVESGENDSAIGVPTRYGTAKGRMQFVDETAARYNVRDPHEPVQAVHGASNYMSDLLTRTGGVEPALLAYSGGEKAYPGKVAKVYQQLVKEQGMAKPPDDFEDLLSLPIKGEKPKSDNWEDLLSLPVKGEKGASSSAPQQFLQNIPADDVAGNAIGKPVRGDKVPGVFTQGAASFPVDPAQKIRIYADKLFSGMPTAQAVRRFYYEGYGTNSRLAAVGMNGEPFFVEPGKFFTRPGMGIQNQDFSALSPGYFAQGVGASLPVAGGIAGGALAAPTSLIAGSAMAAGGAAIGDAVRQFVANKLDPTGGVPYDWMQTGLEAAMAGGGQVMGAGLTRSLAPNALSVPASEIRLARTGGIIPRAQEAYDRAGAQGVTLTPGQASGLPSVLAYEDVAARGPATMDQAKTFYQGQQAQLKGAGENMLSGIAPAGDATDAALKFQAGAEPAIAGIRQRANAIAQPFYQAAGAEGNVSMPVGIGQILKTPAGQKAMDAARTEYANFYQSAAPATPNFELWDLMKRKLDDAYSVASRAGENTSATAIGRMRSQLRDHLDETFPSYALARAAAAPGQREASRLEATAIGKVADMSGGENARPILSGVFERSNPSTIEATRKAFLESGQGDAWYSGVRSYVQSAIEKASQSQEGLNASMLRRNVWANNDVQKAMKAAMTPEQFGGFSNFMQTIEDVARTMPQNSLTQPRQMAADALRNAAGNTMANKLVRGIGIATSPQDLMRLGRLVTDPIDNWITGRNISGIMDNLFSPHGMQMLEDMAKVSPKSNQGRAAALQILTRTAPALPAANDETGQPAGLGTNRLSAPR